MQALADGQGDAFVSAGNSGALLVGATMIPRRIKGIKRAAMAPMLPTGAGHAILLDGGANLECRPEMLVQFAIMGSIYMEKVMGIARPRVAVINNGAEECKGRELEQETGAMLRETDLHFTGNIEARDIPSGDADVLVTDEFVPGTRPLAKFLKEAEGVILGVPHSAYRKLKIKKPFVDCWGCWR